MEGEKPSLTPLSPSSKLQLNEGTTFVDAIEYCKVIGAL